MAASLASASARSSVVMIPFSTRIMRSAGSVVKVRVGGGPIGMIGLLERGLRPGSEGGGGVGSARWMAWGSPGSTKRCFGFCCSCQARLWLQMPQRSVSFKGGAPLVSPAGPGMNGVQKIGKMEQSAGGVVLRRGGGMGESGVMGGLGRRAASVRFPSLACAACMAAYGPQILSKRMHALPLPFMPDRMRKRLERI